MGSNSKIITLCSAIVLVWMTKNVNADDDRWSVFCQRFPTNSNCKQAAPAPAPAPSPPPQPQPGGQGSAPNTPSGNNGQPPPQPSSPDRCASWKDIHDKFCVGEKSNDPQFQQSCDEYRRNCGEVGSVSGSNGPVNPTALGIPPPPPQSSANGQPGGVPPSLPLPQPGAAAVGVPPSPQQPGPGGVPPQPQPGAGQGPQPQGAASTWNQLTQKAQQEQAQEAQQELLNVQNGGAPNCGQYQQNYNVWCGGPQQINAVYCNTLGRVCAEQAQKAAQGQSAIGGPFAGSNGLPTGGAGSTRPLTIGNNFGVGPFFGMGKQLGINPLKGVGQTQNIDIPILGVGIKSSKGVDWGGLPGVAQLGAALGRRKRRWAIPMGVDQLGRVVYWKNW